MSINVNDKNLGHATAYAYYKAGGGTMTEAEFTEFMADFGTASQTAVEAAQAALASKNAAQTAATTATNKATEATTAATTATSKAAEASTSASTATSAKDTAVSASQTATTKATEATTAAATATSAKTDAVAANTAAQSAKTAAQTAQTGAETAAASVAESAAQIQTNAEDISQLKSDLTAVAQKDDMLKAFPTDTASGSVASFADGANVPVKSLIVNIDPVQEGSGDPSPDNVRPISGWSEVNVGVSGKNLFNNTGTTQTINDVTFTVNSDGTISCSGTATATAVFRVYLTNSDLPQNKTLILNGCPSGGSFTSKYGQALCDSLGATLGSTTDDGAGATYSAANLENLAQYQIVVRSGINANGLVFKPMLRLASESDATFEPYQPIQSVNIPLGQTVYGGTLDVVSGVLTVDRAMVDLGSLYWEKYITEAGKWRFGSTVSNIARVTNGSQIPNIVCEVYKTVSPNDTYVGETGISNNASSSSLFICDLSISEKSDLVNVINGKKVVYPLATPIAVQLTPHEVTALLGSNNVWADSGGSTVEYRADPTLYIGRLTEPDADMIADANITSGQYFMVGNTLYKATANIASGATISPNVNCTRKSLSEALNELNA